MKNSILAAIVLCLMVKQSFGQEQRKTALYLQGQYNQTLYDVTRLNNPRGMGLGLQLFLPHTPVLKSTIDLTADAYLGGYKVMYLDADGAGINDIGSMINFFAGGAYQPTRSVYLSFVGGPSFLGGVVKLGVKPAVGFYLSSNQKWMGKLAYINIFNRENKIKEDFGSVSLSLGVRLY